MSQEFVSEQKSKNITLVLTHRCNLDCVYCYEHHKNSCTMSAELAKKIVDDELTMNDGVSMVEFDFFGGEPLLEFDTVKEVVEYAIKKEYDKDYIFFITTNGVLLNEERKEWLRAHTDALQIGLSLDGTKDMHDKNRCGSFDAIDLDFFRTTYPEESVKMTVSKETLPDLAKGVIFCHNEGFDVSCNLAYGIDWDSKENQEIFANQLSILAEYYLENPQIKPCAILDINRIKSLSSQGDRSYRLCGAGYAMRAYDCDGTCYPCQFFLPICVGDEKAKAALSLDFSNFKLADDQIDDKCKTCFIRNTCPTCYGNNYATTGNIYRRDMRLCKMNIIQFQAIAYLAAKRFELGQLGDYKPDEQAAILKSALSIIKELSV